MAIIETTRRRERLHLGLVGAPVHMLPQDAIVFFVETDGIFDLQNLAPAVRHLGVEVVDVTQTVTAECERVGQHPDAIFANVEGVFAVVVRVGVAIGHHHIDQRGAIDERACPPLICVADGVEHQPLARRKSDPEVPLLPRDVVVVHREAWTVCLGNLQGFRSVRNSLM